MKAKTPQELKGLQQQVYRLIQENDGIQNDDADLVAAFWRQEGWSDNRSLEENIRRVTRGETICRRRRELHDMGLITYSPEALKSRTVAFRNEQNTHSYHEANVAEIVKPKYHLATIDGEQIMVLA
jgi:hypothetical protein